MVKIYTKTGDRGETGLWGGGRVSKSHPRVKAYGEVDELNSSLGIVLSSLPKGGATGSLHRSLERIQEELFVLGSLLAASGERSSPLPAPFDRGMPAAAVSRLEAEIDRMTADLAPLKKFILPGGSPAGAFLHMARTVCRRAERAAVDLGEREALPDNAVVYLNRLSDFLFTAARWTNRKLRRPEIQWEGLARQASAKA